MMVKNSRFTILRQFWPTAMIQPKSQNFKIGHDGILSIGNFILVIKNQILIFNCPVTDQQPKNVLPISVATWNFLFIIASVGVIHRFTKKKLQTATTTDELSATIQVFNFSNL
jgi:hypothetical protein